MRRFRGVVFQVDDDFEAHLVTAAKALGIDVSEGGQRSVGLRAVVSAAAEHAATLAREKAKRAGKEAR